MSLNRFAPKRDKNEPIIRKRFAYHGWHTETVSQSGMPDLHAWATPTVRDGARRICFMVDVKDGNGQPTPAQVKKWTALRDAGIPVYVTRTEADVDALVGGTLAPWEPVVKGSIRAPRAHGDDRRPRKGDAAKAREKGRKSIAREILDEIEKGHRKEAKRLGIAVPDYTPPRSTPVDAAKEAEAFAPPAGVLRCERDGCVHSWADHHHADWPVAGSPEWCNATGCRCTGYVGLGPASLRRGA